MLAVFFLIANIFMAKNGFSDPEIASILSVRFASVLFFAVPFGIFIKYRKLKPYFYLVAFTMAVCTYGFVHGVQSQTMPLVYVSNVFLGFCDSVIRIISISYILRNLPNEKHTVGISLNTISWTGSIITSGFLIAFLQYADKSFFNEGMLLTLFALGGLGALFFVFKMHSSEVVSKRQEAGQKDEPYNWRGIAVASMPIVLIATGAGLTIPYINLFFFHSFGVDSNQFSLMGMVSAIIVVGALLVVPSIKKRWGYRAVTFTQSLSVIALILMAVTDFYNEIWWVLFIAIGCYLMRQPLMNLANPMTMEMTMYYVGKPSQELMASIVSSIWSGSWFFSARIFKILSENGLSYGQIFLITACLYIAGVATYHWLIQVYERKKALGLIEG